MRIEYGQSVSKNFRAVGQIRFASDIKNHEFIYFVGHGGKVYHRGWVTSWSFRMVMSFLEGNNLYRVLKCKKYSMIISDNENKGDCDYQILSNSAIRSFDTKEDVEFVINECIKNELIITDFRIYGKLFPSHTKEDLQELLEEINRRRNYSKRTKRSHNE